ncbi:MAG: ABC transporter permease [Bacteroidia bacterium]|nr:ABC transporter permease [Bacteroidia bacterium]MDW8346326.1 ABC transporter permease [Bacteroidia bacterium]
MYDLRILYHLGRYTMMLGTFFRKPENNKIYWEQFMRNVNSIGFGSLGIVFLISLFIGAESALVAMYQITSPWIPDTLVGSVVERSMKLEYAPTITGLVLAGKLGSNIASELGTMRVSEQIDALEVMGINSSGYLIMPKVVAAVILFPILVTIAWVLGIFGGYLAVKYAGDVTVQDYINGMRMEFIPFELVFMLIKSVVFGFCIASISAYQGYNVKGGALEVGDAGTKAVVYSCVMILFMDFILAKILL